MHGVFKGVYSVYAVVAFIFMFFSYIDVLRTQLKGNVSIHCPAPLSPPCALRR